MCKLPGVMQFIGMLVKQFTYAASGASAEHTFATSARAVVAEYVAFKVKNEINQQGCLNFFVVEVHNSYERQDFGKDIIFCYASHFAVEEFGCIHNTSTMHKDD